jgi:hypothetical protein
MPHRFVSSRAFVRSIRATCHSLRSSRSDYVPLVNLISVFFQIRDDYMNLHSNEVSGLWMEPSRSAWRGRHIGSARQR